MRQALLHTLLGLGIAMVALFLFPSSKALALDENKCLLCHSKPNLSTVTSSGNTVSLFVDHVLLDVSAHKFIDCTKCHGTAPHSTPSPLTKLSLAQKCGSCHSYEYQLHLNSVHGQQLLWGNPDVATCVDCHSSNGTPHGVMRVLEYNASAYRKNIAETCSRCHGNEELMAKYGIVEKVYESYMRSFHGKATKLGNNNLEQLNKATCVNCHGSHDVKAVTDPNSPVAGLDNLAKTCEQCHPGAGVKLAKGFLGHQEARPETNPVVYYAERFFLVLTGTVIFLGVVLVTSEITRTLSKGGRKPPDKPEDLGKADLEG